MSAEAATAASPDMGAYADSMKAFMGNLEKTLGKSLDPLKKLSKEMGGSSFGKNIKQFGSALKGMAGASVQAWAMEQLFKLIEPFMKLLKLFELPIGVVSALLTMLVNEIFKDLIPYFITFSVMLFGLMPIFQKIGEVIGWLLSTGINLLILGLTKLWEFLKVLVPFLKDVFVGAWIKIKEFFIELGAKIKSIWQGIFGRDGVIVTLFNAFVSKMKEIWANIFGPNGFFAKGIQGFVNILKAIVNGILGAINVVIGVLNKIPGVDIKKIPMLAEGGITTGPTLAMLGEKGTEIVLPLDRLKDFGGSAQMLSELEENNRLMRILVSRKREAERWSL